MQRHQQKQHVFLIILVLLHTMVCFNLKFTYNFALLINMMLLMKKGILGCNIILYLANLHTSFLCNLIYPTFTTLLVYIN